MDAGRDGEIDYIYRQAAAEIERRIRNGTWPYGTRLPARAALAAELGVGEMTARHATDILADPEREGGAMVKKMRSTGVWVIWTGEPGT